jgi:hypothetical protein
MMAKRRRRRFSSLSTLDDTVSLRKTRINDVFRRMWDPAFAAAAVRRWRDVLELSGVGLAELFNANKGVLSVQIDSVNMVVSVFCNPKLSVVLQDVCEATVSSTIVADIHDSQQLCIPSTWRNAYTYYAAALESDHDTVYGYTMAAFLAQRYAVFGFLPADAPNLALIWDKIWTKMYCDAMSPSPVLVDVFRASTDSTLGIFIGKAIAVLQTHMTHREIAAWHEETIAADWSFTMPRDVEFCTFFQRTAVRTACLLAKVHGKRRGQYDTRRASRISVHIAGGRPRVEEYAIAHVDKAICLLVLLLDVDARREFDVLSQQELVPDFVVDAVARHMPFL